MTTVKQYLTWCASQVGTQERPRGTNRQPYAALAHHADGYAWCATYLVAGARQTGLGLPSGADTASCALNEAAFKRAGRLYTTPQVGDWLFVYFPSLARAAHTGVVVAVDGAYVRTVEGNSNDEGGREGYEVCRRRRAIKRPIGGVGIRSFGRPYYTATSAKAPAKKPTEQPTVTSVEDDMQARFVMPQDHRTGDALLVVSVAGVELVANTAHRDLLLELGVPRAPKEWERADYERLRAVAEGGLSGGARAALVEELRAAVTPSVKPL